MSQERRLAILEAFISTKPREFDAFKQAWDEQNPEAATVVEEEKPKRKLKTKPEAVPDAVPTESP